MAQSIHHPAGVCNGGHECEECDKTKVTDIPLRDILHVKNIPFRDVVLDGTLRI